MTIFTMSLWALVTATILVTSGVSLNKWQVCLFHPDGLIDQDTDFTFQLLGTDQYTKPFLKSETHANLLPFKKQSAAYSTTFISEWSSRASLYTKPKSYQLRFEVSWSALIKSRSVLVV